MKKYITPLALLVTFEVIVITLWQTQNNIFYLFNFSYIGIFFTRNHSLCKKQSYAHKITQLLVGFYMLEPV